MSRRRRNAINTKGHFLRYNASKWLKMNKDVAFNNPILTDALGLDPFSRLDTWRVYHNVILYWRKKFIRFYEKQKKAGLLNALDRNSAWDLLLLNYNQNDCYVFLYDRDKKYYIQPSLQELEIMDKKRLENKWKGILTVIEEMKMFDARLLTDGLHKTVGELEKAGKDFDNLLLKGKTNF